MVVHGWVEAPDPCLWVLNKVRNLSIEVQSADKEEGEGQRARVVSEDLDQWR